MSKVLDLSLPVAVESASSARHQMRELSGVLETQVIENVSLLVSELVTNTLRHAGLGPSDRVDVRVRANDRRVRVEVVDRGRGFHLNDNLAPSADRLGGWGLYLVEQLANRWGVDDAAPGTSIWFEIDRPQRGLRPRAPKP